MIQAYKVASTNFPICHKDPSRRQASDQSLPAPQPYPAVSPLPHSRQLGATTLLARLQGARPTLAEGPGPGACLAPHSCHPSRLRAQRCWSRAGGQQPGPAAGVTALLAALPLPLMCYHLLYHTAPRCATLHYTGPHCIILDHCSTRSMGLSACRCQPHPCRQPRPNEYS